MNAEAGRQWAVAKWLPIIGLAIATGVGAWLGVMTPATSAPPPADGLPPLLRQIIGATRSAGSALVTYTSVAAGSNPLLSSTSNGSGVVDFASGEFRTVSVQHSTELAGEGGGQPRPSPESSTVEEIMADGRLYQRLPSVGVGGLEWPGISWIRLPPLAQSPPIVFGPVDQSDAVQALQPLSEPYQRVSIVADGHTSIGGSSTARYKVTVVPRTCEARSIEPRPTTIDIWVAGDLRLVQARSVSKDTVAVPKKATTKGFHFPAELAGTIVTTSMLRVDHYGEVVPINPPHPIAQPSGSGISTLSIGSCPPP